MARHSSVVLSALALALGTSIAVAQDEVPFSWQIERVADGVYAAIHPRELWVNDSNSAVIVGERDVLIVDAQADPTRVRALLGEIASRTKLPIRTLVNTHWHSDHTQGNALYRELAGEVEIIGHETLTADVPQRAKASVDEEIARLAELLPRAEEQLRKGARLDGQPLTAEQRLGQRAAIDREQERLGILRVTELLAPTRTYSQRLTLFQGDREIRLIHLPGHTRGDTVVFLPREKVLITGDLLDVMPYVGHGSPAAWSRSLTRLRELDFELIVPGHGPVFRGKGQLDKAQQFLDRLIEHAAASKAAGWSEDEAVRRLDLLPLRRLLAGDDPRLGRVFDKFAPEAAARARQETRGELDDAGWNH